MAETRLPRLRESVALVWLALAASCGGRTPLYGDPVEGDLLGGAGDDGSSGGTRSGRGGRSGTGSGGDAASSGESNTGGSTNSDGGTANSVGGNGPNSGGTTSMGGVLIAGSDASGGTSSGASSSGGSATGGVATGGLSGLGGQSGSPQAGKGGEAGESDMMGVPCGDTICDSRATCCVGLTATTCLPADGACNGAILHCSAAASCDPSQVCCLTMGGGMATAECADSCTNSFNGNGRLNLRLCASDDDCTGNRECRMTFIGVNACMRRL